MNALTWKEEVNEQDGSVETKGEEVANGREELNHAC